MIFCNNATGIEGAWIIDYGTSDHMTSTLSTLSNPMPTPLAPKINLPTGATASISHIGQVHLPNGIVLKNVLCVPHFKHNLLSVQKLIREDDCEVQFYPKYCVILDSGTKKVKGVSKAQNGLYYLINTKVSQGGATRILHAPQTHTSTCPAAGTQNNSTNFSLWHHRLGHASTTKLQYIPCVKPLINKKKPLCLTCPMGKFTKQPFPISNSHAFDIFQLIHMDIWGPYKVCTRGKYRYFLTIVDDCFRHT